MILYKHPNMRDIAFEKLGFKKTISTKIIIRVRYWVRLPNSANEYEPMDLVEDLMLPLSKLKEWIRV